MINLKFFVFNALGVNTYVLYDNTHECIIVDPAFNTASQQQELINYLSENNLQPVQIINTHGHFDHVFGNYQIKALYKCPLLIHEKDLPLLQHVDKYAGIFGFKTELSPMPDGYLNDNEIIHFGTSQLKVIHVPGHSPGSICLYSQENKMLIVGDVLFLGGIGRTDLPGGNYDDLINGIQKKLLSLPRDTVVWPGHGQKTTIGYEYDTNPFLN